MREADKSRVRQAREMIQLLHALNGYVLAPLALSVALASACTGENAKGATAAVIGAASSVIGLYLSYYWNVASGAAVVLTATAVFGVVYLLNPRAGVLRSMLRG